MLAGHGSLQVHFFSLQICPSIVSTGLHELCTVAARGACRTLLACCVPLPPAKAPMAALHVGVGLVTGLPVRQPTAKGARAATQNQTSSNQHEHTSMYSLQCS